MNNFLEQQLPAIITGLLGLGAWIMEKRKKHAEVQRVESDATQAMQQAYKTFVADSNEKFEQMRAELELSRREIQELKAEIEEWQTKYESLLREVRSGS